MGVESYKHQFAKATLTQWLRECATAAGHDNSCNLAPISWRVNRGPDHWGVWSEYPICLDHKNDLVGYGAWDEEYYLGKTPEELAIMDRIDPLSDNYSDLPKSNFELRPPSYNEVISFGLLPIVIFDVAVQHKGGIVYGLEVVHKNGISEIKQEYLNRIKIPTYTIDADWILSRVKRPDALVCQRVY